MDEDGDGLDGDRNKLTTCVGDVESLGDASSDRSLPPKTDMGRVPDSKSAEYSLLAQWLRLHARK